MSTEQITSEGSQTELTILDAVSPSLVHHIREISGQLTRTVMAHMSVSLPFFAELDAKHRADIGALVQSAIRFFADWVQNPENNNLDYMDVLGSDSVHMVEGLSLQQSVSILHSSMEVIEQAVINMKDMPEAKVTLLVHALRYSRELGFSIADYFAAAAEKRGAWDARMETALVDAVVRGAKSEDIRSFGSALACDANQPVTVMVGTPRSMDRHERTVLRLHQAASDLGYRALAAVQGPYLVTLVNVPAEVLMDPECPLYEIFSDDQIMLGPTARNLAGASRSAEEAFAALRVAQAMPNVPRVAAADMFIPERAIAGDHRAVQRLFHGIIKPLQKSASAAIRDTLRLYLSVDGGVEEAARQLYVHPNTVRYRLKRVNDITGMDPLDSRMRFTLRIANVLGMLEDINESSNKSW